MFRCTLTLVAIILILNQLNIAATRSLEEINTVKKEHNEKKKREGITNLIAVQVSEKHYHVQQFLRGNINWEVRG